MQLTARDRENEITLSVFFNSVYFRIIWNSFPILSRGPLIRINSIIQNGICSTSMHVSNWRPNEWKAKQTRTLKGEYPMPISCYRSYHPLNIKRQLVVFKVWAWPSEEFRIIRQTLRRLQVWYFSECNHIQPDTTSKHWIHQSFHESKVPCTVVNVVCFVRA